MLNEDPACNALFLSGGQKHKNHKKKATSDKYEGRVVYVGPRGGKYIKVKGEYKRILN